MIIGICDKTMGSNVLVEGKKYFLFTNGEKHFYVSNFPNINAHMGCFRKELFSLDLSDTGSAADFNIEEIEFEQLSLFT